MEYGTVYEEFVTTPKNKILGEVRVKWYDLDTYVVIVDNLKDNLTLRYLLSIDTTYGQAIRFGITEFENLKQRLG